MSGVMQNGHGIIVINEENDINMDTKKNKARKDGFIFKPLDSR